MRLPCLSPVLCLLLLVFTWSATLAACADAQTGDSPPSPPAAASSTAPERVQVPEPTPLALEYRRTGDWLWLFNQTWAILLPAAIVFSGLSARIRNLASGLTGGRWGLTIAVYVIIYMILVFVVELPIAYYEGFVRQHAYGLSNQTLAKWILNRTVDLGVSSVVSVLIAWLAYALLAKSPRRWWLSLGLASVPLLALGTLVKPIWIDPLINTYGPMKNHELERSILDLAGRAGIEGGRVFEVDKSVDTKTVNAYVTGIGNTKRIVLWDTLISKLEPAEVLVVMGHEMGHYVLGHVIRTICLAPLLVIPALFFVNWWGLRLIQRHGRRLGFDRLSDVASAPLLLMMIEVASLVLSPAALAYSRAQEHAADRYALELTHDNHAGATAFRKLQTENLGIPRPGILFTLFRASHPSLGDRIDFCNDYHPWIKPPR